MAETNILWDNVPSAAARSQISMASPPSNATSDFRSFERVGWQSVAEPYHQAFATLTPQAVGPLLEAVGAGSGVRLLDLASGPGYAAAEAKRRGARVLGMDFSIPMVAQARRHHPAVEFLVGDAEQMPFPDARFDAAVMNFGLLHLAQPEQALQEIHRVLCRGGRCGFTVWTKPEEAVSFGIVLRAIETCGTLEASLPPGPPFFRFSEPQECDQALRAAGFENPRVSKIPQLWQLPSADTLFHAMQSGTVRTGGLLRAQTPEALEAIRNAIREAAAAYETNGVLRLPMPAILAVAVKP